MTSTPSPTPNHLAPLRHPFRIGFKVGGMVVADIAGHVYAEANSYEPVDDDGLPAWVLTDIDVIGFERAPAGGWVSGSARLPDTSPFHEPIMLTLLQQSAVEIACAWVAHVAAAALADVAAGRQRFAVVATPLRVVPTP